MTNAKKKIFMLMLLIICCIATSLLSNLTASNTVILKPAEQNAQKKVNNKNGLNTSKSVENKNALIKVYVSGAVLLPGIYELPSPARAQQVIKAAGGMLESADQDRVNLAKPLKDGMQINVPSKKGQKTKIADTAVELKTEKLTTQLPKAAPVRKTFAYPININKASQKELEAIPGIGPTMAVRIISQRSLASFQKPEDLLRVQGIGKAKLEKIRGYICVR